MAEKGIIFKGWGVRAILADLKTQTRRCEKGLAEINREPDAWEDVGFVSDPANHFCGTFEFHRKDYSGVIYVKPRYAVGDLIWVKEVYAYMWPPDCGDGLVYDDANPEGRSVRPDECTVEYKADTGHKYPGDWPDDCGDDAGCPRWRSPLFMPKRVARLWLRVTDVRVQRVQEISEEDAKAEGIFAYPDIVVWDAGEAFAGIWNQINAKRGYGWDANPWVFAYTFERTEHGAL